MNGGLAARRTVAPETAPPSRPAPAPPAPVREPPTAAIATTRDRMQASFGASVPEPAAVEETSELTTRARIVNRARADEVEVPVAAPAPVIDLGEARERLRPPAPEAPAGEGPPAQVIELATTTEPTARAPPAAAPTPAEAPMAGDAGAVLARAPPAPETAGPAEPEAEALAPEEAAAGVGVMAVVAVPRSPEEEPGFQAMKARADENATRTKDHQPARLGAATAQAASEPDVPTDVGSQAAGEQVGVMGSKKPGKFDPAAFKAAVAAAVARMAPPATLKEADEFKQSGKSGGAATAIHGLVSTGKANSEREIKDANETTPKPEGRKPKVVVKPMVNDRPGPPLPSVEAEAALPGLRPDSETDLSMGPLAIKLKLAEAKVTEPQLAEGNEPAFNGALDATQKVREHAATAPAGYREQEAGVLAAGRSEAGPAAAAQLEGMHGSRFGTLGTVLGKKDATKLADKTLHDDVHGKILDIHSRTQSDVRKILGLLDKAVESLFVAGEAAARKTFEEEVARDMRAYKRRRYGGWFGWTKWLKDRWWDLPSEVNAYYVAGRKNYLKAMDGVIETIAFVVGLMLGLAHLRILAGRDEVAALVKNLPDSLKELGRTTAADLDHKFDDLAADVDAKRDELVDTVARLYIDSRDKLDERIKDLKEANKGLISRAIDAVIGVLKTIYELGKLLLRVLLKAASAIGDILAHPIRFLGNLVGAVKGGLERFVSRISEHLQKAMLDLLFGELGSTLTMPKQLDFAGILDLVLQVVGLTYKDIRDRLVLRFGEEAVAHMEETVDVFKTILSDGLGGLWTWIRDKIGDLEELVIGKIKTYIVDRVIKAGIGYIVALLNPAAAFIKACQGIYQIVMFVIERARQIAAFVESVLDSISAIAKGDIGTAVDRIDSALGDALSLAVAFLGRLANLGSLSEKMRSIIAAVRRPVTRAVDLVVFGAADLYRRTIGRAVAFGRGKIEAGREWAKGKVDAGREWARNKAEAGKLRVASRDLPRAPPPEAERPQPVAPEPAWPVRLAERGIEVVPGERHTLFVLLSADGQVDIGISSTPQRISAMLRVYEPRIEALPDVAPVPLPRGGEPQDRPRSHARNGAAVIRADPEMLEADLERTFATVLKRKGGEVKPVVFATGPVVPRATPTQAQEAISLATVVGRFLRLFRVYERPEFDRVEDEPAGGQKLIARVWARPDEDGYILPARGRLGLDPKRARGADYAFIEPAPELAAPTRGAVDPGGGEKVRGIVGQLGQDPVRPDVLVRTFAVGDTGDEASNTSHTENLFAHWFTKQNSDFWQRVTAIELRSLNSPCPPCSGVLKLISERVGERVPLTVHWDQVYNGKKGKGRALKTTLADIKVLREAHWLVDGPMPPR